MLKWKTINIMFVNILLEIFFGKCGLQCS